MSTPRATATRADGRRSREALLRSAGEMLAAGEAFTLAQVAEAAELGTATAYRHFDSADGVTEAYVAGFWDDVDERMLAVEHPDLAVLCRVWVGAVLDWGPALVYLRSRDGFLARRARGDERVGRLVAVAEPCLAQEAARGHLESSPEALSYALAVWNALADPREILDQRDSLGWSHERIAENLRTTVLASFDVS